MISEADAREAARHLAVGRERLSRLDKEDVEFKSIARDMDSHAWRLACFAVDELVRREAEQAERAKPIDGEWCLANGAVYNREKRRYQFPGGARQVIWSTGVGVGLYFGALGMAFTPEVTTCGGLSDLLAALRGTERPA